MSTLDALPMIDLPAGGNSTLRLALVDDGAAGRVVILSHGFGEGSGFHRPAFCGTPVRLPASILPELRAALAALEDGAEA